MCPASIVITCPASGYRWFRLRSSGANSGTSFVFAPMRVSAITAVSSCSAAASRYGTCPPVPAAPRTALPSTAMPGSQPGAATGKTAGPAAARAARYAPAWSASCCALTAVNTRTIVSGCGGTQAPSASRRQPRTASTWWSAALTQAVTSSSVLFPHSAAAADIASTEASRCRIPRGSRGSGTCEKHSSRFPPDAACRLAACAASSSMASSAHTGAGMPDWMGNGASRQGR